MLINDFLNNFKDTYIIAEVSQNHDGSLGQAHAFIDAVVKTGVDAIKFQTHIAEEESTKKEPFRVNFSYCDKTRYDYWKRMEFSKEQWRELFEHAQSVGLDFLSSPFSVTALEMLNDIGVPAWKFGSGEVFNTQLLNRAIQTKKPIILSTGLSTLGDIDNQITMIRNAGNRVILMECTTAYPSKSDEIPISLIPKLIERYRIPVGISDHSATIFPSLSAVTLGAKVIEVHVTMSRDMFGPDIKSSVTMDELKEIKRGTDFITGMLNVKYDKARLDEKKENLKVIFSKSIYARKALYKGDVLNEKTIAVKKPFDDRSVIIDDFEKICGMKLKSDIEEDGVITWEDIES